MMTVAAPLRTSLRRALAAVTTPLLPADYLDLLAPLHSGAALRARIESIVAETPEAATLVLRPGRGWAGHVPGQYVRIGVDVDGVRLWRAYSITSGPRTDGLISITVKAMPDGRVSNHLVGRAQLGTVVQLDPAAGEFTLPAVAPARTLFVTAGSGITPVMGMLRHRLPELADVVVVHSAPTADSAIFGAALRGMAGSGRIRLVERHTDTDRILTPRELDGLVPDWSARQAWACGPTRMLDALEEHWSAAGVADRLHTERFRAAVLVVGDGGPVTFTGTGTRIQASGGTPLLDEGEAAGVLMPSGCRMGICMGCVVPLASGAVRDLRNGALTTAAPGDGVQVQTCINAAAGACELDI
ncbi:MAG: ferredoxin reductase [Candidatus Nanopelagicales bacterium]